MKQKQLAKGIDQLMDEGVAQLFVNQFNGRKIIGTVGQLQFEVIQYRLENEYSAKCRWEPLSLYKPAGLRAMMRRSWKPSRSANTSTWPKTARVGMCSWPTADMCCRWRRWTSSISSSTLRVSSKLYDFADSRL